MDYFRGSNMTASLAGAGAGAAAAAAAGGGGGAAAPVCLFWFLCLLRSCSSSE